MIDATTRRILKRWILSLALSGLLAALLAACAAIQGSPEESPQPDSATVQKEPAAPPPPSPPPPPVPTKIVATVTAYRLNVRQGPSMDDKIIGVLTKDEQVEIRDFSGSWYRIHTPSLSDGWVSGKFLTGFMEIKPAPGGAAIVPAAQVPKPVIEEASPSADPNLSIRSETIEKELTE